MKTRILLILLSVAAGGTLVWQRQSIAELRASEALAADARTGVASPLSLGFATTRAEKIPCLPEPEFASLLERVSDYRSLKKAKRADTAWAMLPALYAPFSRLSAQQINALLNAWSEGQPITDDFLEDNDSFLWVVFQVASVNPRETLKALLQDPWPSRSEHRISHFALHIWFQDDPASMERWLRVNCRADTFDGEAALWADATKVLLEPSLENVRRFLAHEGDQPRWSGGDLMLKLGRPEARIAFLQSLHVATGGISDDLPALLGPLMKRTSFGQLAQLGDAVPAIRASGKLNERSDWAKEFPEPLGSLRYEIARSCRDGTASQRWAWLVKREEDRPTGKALETLVERWCANDYADTSAWAHGLLESPERVVAIKRVEQFLADNE